MKNVNKRKATSHIAVISSDTLCRLALTFGITINNLNCEKKIKIGLRPKGSNINYDA